MKDLQILAAARDAWLAADNFRSRRERCKRYTYGDQWSDPEIDANGNAVTEFDNIVRSGKKPLTNNVIRQIVKVVVGRYRYNCATDGVYNSDSPSKRYIADNALSELDSRMLEEFLISGCAVQRVSRDRRPGFDGISVDNVDPRMFFVNAHKDPRGRDIELIGMLHDYSLAEIISRFGDGTQARVAEISRAFARSSAAGSLAQSGLGLTAWGADDFFCSSSGKCRVIEVWTLDCRNKLICHDPEEAELYTAANSSAVRRSLRSINRRRAGDGREPVNVRQSVDFVWHCRWFAPDGTVLASYDTPYAHCSHPFVLKFYPMTDGEVHSLVEDVIGQQRCINRLIVMIDHMIGSSAKGVLLFPVEQKLKEFSWENISEQWSRTNGVIPISGRTSCLPQQVVAQGADAGAYELLSLQMKLLDNISGVGDALAGRTVAASTGNALYENQLRNSAIAIADLIETFAAFRRQRDDKALNLCKK